MEIIGRKAEIRELEKYYDSGRPELVIIYGRRRVGKTFLIREYFENNFAFYYTGSIGVPNSVNLINFDRAIREHGGEVKTASKLYTLRWSLHTDSQKRDITGRPNLK